jgi:hypothetical protein
MKSLAKVKRRVAKFIRNNPEASYDQWVSFQREVPEIRIRQVTDSITQINLEGNTSFIDPSSWLNNYIAGQKIKLRESLSTSCKVLTQEEIIEVIMDLEDSDFIKELLMDAYRWDAVYKSLLRISKEGSRDEIVEACVYANFICQALYGRPFDDDEGLRKLLKKST